MVQPFYWLGIDPLCFYLPLAEIAQCISRQVSDNRLSLLA